MSDCYDLGIDVEEIIYLDIEQFRDCFSVKELKVIFKAENSLNEFYKLWTKKEAIIKADGRGFGIDLRELNVLLPRVSICSAVYEVSPIEIGPNYVAHLATRLNEPNFGYEAVDLQDIPLQSLLDCKMVI
ncbi:MULTISPECIES: 4'-phosphopantetheinyl transferase superfamily protein [Sphingobacterium]|uniref:4'-phosphopantetheinyl transferase superfamily protein n=1 Tax=Sphingobacterium TaxID=28453 RepID=UPI0025796FA9|nr:MULTISPECIES: 4'-phosphopantetheinyl transferase superfamily protein [Sphingobacterium]